MSHESHELDLGASRLACCKMFGEQSDADYRAMLATLEQVMLRAREQQTKLVQIVDLSAAAPTNAQQRRIQAEWNVAHEQLSRTTTLGICFVFTSVVMRGVITAVLWLKPLPVEHTVVPDLADAVDWSLARFRTSGFTLPDDARDQAHRMFVTQSHKPKPRASR